MVRNDAALLNSWKEIAQYLDRGVRTAQRWERSGLPVHRIGSGPRCPVIAFPKEIDAWLHQFPSLQNHSAERIQGSHAAVADVDVAMNVHLGMLEKVRTSLDELTVTVAASRAFRYHVQSSRIL
jgi:hypothetical protein